MAPPLIPRSDRSPTLQATYVAPATPSASQAHPGRTHTFTRVLSASLSDSPAGSDITVAKTAYLSELRGAVSTLQTELNEFLTARMDEDNYNNSHNQQPTSGGADRMKSEKERREEENYGEEVLDDED
ncbi:hypothetical protein AJ78_01629 [Emergomyces pasteurianus Ep9510]|uniref:EKC/KEOPS complex subunit GON7 n=1 Tax=Emergomyces pasteurianus Ep9510 TaxID=1447872 RepID=A0A1J9QR11_9EURO|nr:hypothetical protein AJ78_01629 [Emergomyces pasteurianus Ep9510]